MKLTVASPRGFCAGVEMAIQTLDKALEIFGTPLYAYHEIVHNEYVVGDFRKRGVVFVERVEDVPSGAILLFSAHGISPAVRKASREKGLRTIDATCPLVSKVHIEAVNFSKRGYQIVYIGHKGHQEVIGTLGEAPDCMHLVEDLNDVEALVFPEGTKLAYLTQTTLSVDEVRLMIERLKQRFPQIEGPKKEDICYATQNRQDAVKTFCEDADLTLVVGSQNSSNSRRLVEVAKGKGRPAYMISGAEAIRKEWLEGVSRVLLTASASAPETLVRDCVRYFVDIHGAEVLEPTAPPEMVSFPLPREIRTAEFSK